MFYISALNVAKIKSAIENEAFNDFEDCLQEECAVEIMADYIVTRTNKILGNPPALHSPIMRSVSYAVI